MVCRSGVHLIYSSRHDLARLLWGHGLAHLLWGHDLARLLWGCLLARSVRCWRAFGTANSREQCQQPVFAAHYLIIDCSATRRSCSISILPA